MNTKNLTLKWTLVSGFSGVVTLVLGYYLFTPAINMREPLLWCLLTMSLGTAALVGAMLTAVEDTKLPYGAHWNNTDTPDKAKYDSIKRHIEQTKHMTTTLGMIAVVVLLTLAILAIASSPLVSSGKYVKMIAGVDTHDISKYQRSTNEVPLMDKDSAVILANRKMGGLLDLVSQFDVSEKYNAQINFRDTPVRVAPLGYSGFIKWMTNKSEGIPGYMMTNMLTKETELVRVKGNINYSPSSYFNNDLYRYVRFKHPTLIIGKAGFEVDEKGNPYWVIPVYDKAVAVLKMNIGSALIIDAVTGNIERKSLKDIPTWVDRVFPADKLLKQFDYYGEYQSGFINSILGQRGVIKSTDGYNYIAMDDDIWVYSGITSATSDESNVGFVFINQRTGKSIRYNYEGSQENAAMASAEGIVQSFEYTATFPLLVRLNGDLVYYMALKDEGGLVKMYALVNVADSQKVVAEKSIESAISEYYKQYFPDETFDGTKESLSGEVKTSTGNITDIRTENESGNTIYYIKIDSLDKYVRASVKQGTFVLLNVGDNVTLRYSDGEMFNSYKE